MVQFNHPLVSNCLLIFYEYGFTLLSISEALNIVVIHHNVHIMPILELDNQLHFLGPQN